jgi:hypothetical protein
MADKKEEKKNFITSLFKKDKGSADELPAAEPSRRRLHTQLSDAEKSKRRSTIGASTGLQMTMAISGQNTASSSPVASPPTLAKAGSVVEVDTQFSKLLKASPTPTHKTDTNPAESAIKSKKAGMSADEKKARRLSLLAPINNLFAPKDKDGAPMIPTSSGASKNANDPVSKKDSIAPDGIKARRTASTHIFKKDSYSDLSFSKLGVNQGTGGDSKLMKQKQKQLQKQMDKEEKKASKEEKRKQEKALEILQAQLELGRDRAVMPEPQPRFVTVPAVRPARLLSMK